MTFQEGRNPCEPPQYDHEDFNYWKQLMECFLGSVDIDYMLILREPSQNSELNKKLIKLHETPMELEDQVKVKYGLESNPTEKPTELGVALKGEIVGAVSINDLTQGKFASGLTFVLQDGFCEKTGSGRPGGKFHPDRASPSGARWLDLPRGNMRSSLQSMTGILNSISACQILLGKATLSCSIPTILGISTMMNHQKVQLNFMLLLNPLHEFKEQAPAMTSNRALVCVSSRALFSTSRGAWLRLAKIEVELFELAEVSEARHKKSSDGLKVTEHLVKASPLLKVNTKLIYILWFLMITPTVKISKCWGGIFHFPCLLTVACFCGFLTNLLIDHLSYMFVNCSSIVLRRRCRTSADCHQSNASQGKCYFHIGSSNLGMGNRITVAPKNLEDGFLVAAQRHLGFIHFMDGKLVPTYKFLAKLTNVCVKVRKVDKLSNFLINMDKDIDPGGPNLCSDVLHACIMLGWLDTAHDILDDLELAKVSIEASSYLALLNAYSKKNMYKESRILVKQMKKSGLVFSISDEYKCALGYASFPISDIKASNSLEKSELVQSLELENKKYNLESELIYEFNSSILFFCRAKMMEDALKTLKRMREKNVQPTVLTFSYLVNGYSSLEMYREIIILWGDIRRQMECGALSANRDLFDCLLWNFLKGGYFARSMEIVDYMLKNNVYVDKWKYRMEFLKHHKNLYQSLKESSCRTDTQSRRLQHVKAFRKWAGIDQ
ncbi:hypothetical protein ZIOFF_015454 [Zingiber officinale]|uniref:Pentatricopeptide repeat-containing protein n=1 Tax=Zingiber officinale TaxID=94328 RepID=A0A8J5I0C0_ZINOF|nr:hypothetical protein ZIOFF_015454 [Zingiber officinale]